MASKRPRRHNGKLKLWPLVAVIFFIADMQSGIGPFVGVFLLERGWNSGCIGTALAIGDIAGMLITTPVGGFIDASRQKRAWVIVPGIAVVSASSVILFSQNFWTVIVSQIASSTDAAIVPAVTGITLGMVGQRGFNRQNGRNQAFNNAGNLLMATATLFGLDQLTAVTRQSPGPRFSSLLFRQPVRLISRRVRFSRWKHARSRLHASFQSVQLLAAASPLRFRCANRFRLLMACQLHGGEGFC